MELVDGKGMREAFEYVRDCYRTATRLLGSADAIMADHGLTAYAWDAIWPRRRTGLQHVDEWLPTFVLRQWHPPVSKDREVVTVGCVFHALDDRALVEPLCVASRMALHQEPGNEVYRWALVQRWAPETAPADGTARVLRSDQIAFRNGEREDFEANVVGKTVATLAVPLLSVTSSADLEVLKPLLAFTFHPDAL